MARMSFPRIIHPHKIDGSDPERCQSRINFLGKYILPGSRGAELGVFTGAFIDWLLALYPAMLYVVDPWYRQGSTWEWAVGKPSTLEALVNILRLFSGEINAGTLIPVVDYSENFLRNLKNGSLDWVYIDTTHAYEQTKVELLLACSAVGEDGIILGDDCDENPKARHHGVYQAVKELESAGILILLAMEDGQFSAQPGENWRRVAETHYHHLMPPGAPSLPEVPVSTFVPTSLKASDTALPAQAHICAIRLFFSSSPQVALYGSPSTVDDGWIANLPASEVFDGDFSCLFGERLIDAQEAHERAGFHREFYERNVRNAPQPQWPPKAPAIPAGPDPKLGRAALQYLNTAHVLASRLAQQARRDNRPEDQQRFLAAAADAALKAADLQGNAEAAAQLREQALRQLASAHTLAARLAEQARRDERRQDQQRWLSAAADAALKAYDLQGDADAAAELREQALR